MMLFATGLAACLLTHTVIINSYENRAITVRINEVQTQMKILANHLINYNYLSDQSSETVNAELDLLSNLYEGRVMIIDSNLKIVKDTYNISQGKTIISQEIVNCLRNGADGTTSRYDPTNGYIEITIPIIQTRTIGTSDVKYGAYDNTEQFVRGVMLVSVSTDTIETTLRILTERARTIEVIVIVAMFAFAGLLANLLMRPFDRITSAINDVKAGYSDNAIVGPEYVETEHIVNAFNQLMKRMKVLDDSRSEFVSNVSHELKTPITSMKVIADSLLSQEDVPNEVYRDFMEDIGHEVDREDKIINDLLALVKMDKKAAELNIAQVDVGYMIEIICKRLRPIARKNNIELTLEIKRKITAEIDEVKISLAIMNLIENAIKYNQENGWVKVVVDSDHQFFVVTVSDSGIGIPEDAIDHIYERFYRVDKSRSREIGGTGLGLAITRNSILMHRGSINVTSVLDEGTTFEVKIPLIYLTPDKQSKK